MAGSAFRTLSMPKVCVEEIKYSGKPFSFAAILIATCISTTGETGSRFTVQLTAFALLLLKVKCTLAL
jgi:hypothetical protein